MPLSSRPYRSQEIRAAPFLPPVAAPEACPFLAQLRASPPVMTCGKEGGRLLQQRILDSMAPFRIVLDVWAAAVGRRHGSSRLSSLRGGRDASSANEHGDSSSCPSPYSPRLATLPSIIW
jgi:hypothetical protein